MATAKQVAPSRRNSQNSTGPSSPEGKQKVSQNRLKHGLSGGVFRVIESESQEDQKARGVSGVAVRNDLTLHLRHQTTHDRLLARGCRPFTSTGKESV